MIYALVVFLHLSSFPPGSVTFVTVVIVVTVEVIQVHLRPGFERTYRAPADENEKIIIRSVKPLRISQEKIMSIKKQGNRLTKINKIEY